MLWDTYTATYRNYDKKKYFRTNTSTTTCYGQDLDFTNFPFFEQANMNSKKKEKMYKTTKIRDIKLKSWVEKENYYLFYLII